MSATRTPISLSRPLARREALVTARAALATTALAAIVAATALIAAATATGSRFLTDLRTPRFPDWVAGPLSDLGVELSPTSFSLWVLVMLGAYVVALTISDAVRPRQLIVAIGALHVLLVLAPPILSVDLFGYLNYARLDAVHGVNPYEHGAAAAPADPTYPYLVWHYLPSPYGPVFTALLHPFGLIDFRVSLWAMNAVLVAASLGCIALVWRCARLRGNDPVRAAILVGLNPLLLVWAVGGAHNDLLVALLMAVGIERFLAAARAAPRGEHGGERRKLVASGAGMAGAALVKATGGLALPFALASARRRAGASTPLIAGVVAAAVVAFAAGAALLGSGVAHYPAAVAEQQDLVTAHSLPVYAGSMLGLPDPASALQPVATAAFAVAFAIALLCAWRGADWIRAAAWATVALLLSTVWLMPWYIVWLLPLAAIGGGRRLEVATVAVTAFIVVMRVPLLLG